MDYSLLKNKLYLHLLVKYNGVKKPSFVQLGKELNITRQTASTQYKKLVDEKIVAENEEGKIFVSNPLNVSITDIARCNDYKELKKAVIYNNTCREYNIENTSDFTPMGSVVYGIISEGKIKYVGTSKNLQDRIDRHINKRPFLERKDFIILKEVNSNENKFNYELELIHLLQPEWNILGKE